MKFIDKDKGYQYEPDKDGPMFDEDEDGSIDCPACYGTMKKADDFFWECSCGNIAWKGIDGHYYIHGIADYSEIYE